MSRCLRSLVVMAVALLAFLPAYSQHELYSSYINQYTSMAVEQMVRYRIPASITMAQALLESRAGTSRLATQGRNHFGIKCGSSWTGPYMLVNDDAPNEHFRVYQSVRESYEDHSRFLTLNQRYGRLFTLRMDDYRGWARGLKAAGYATNPRYGDILIQLIEDYQLADLDRMTLANIPVAGDMSSGVFAHQINLCNGQYYIIARQGDTFKSLSKELDISARKLRKYNELPKDYTIGGGEIFYLGKKRTKADRSLKGMYHTMIGGESLYEVAQCYGVRLKTLYKVNGLPSDYVPQEGDQILLRK